MAQKVRDVMTRSPVTVSPDTDVVGVARQMSEHDIGAVLVVDGGKLEGIVTDRDLVVRWLAAGADPAMAEVRAIASPADVTVSPDDPLTKAVQLMREHSVRRLPVVEDGAPAGIIALADLAMERDERSALADISAAKPDN